MTRLSDSALTRKLAALGRAEARAIKLHGEIAEHCLAVYGVQPGDVDNDEFIDAPGLLDAEQFHESMLDAMEHCGISSPPNTEINGRRSRPVE